MPIRASQIDLESSQFAEGGTGDRQVILKDGGVAASKLGFSWKVVSIDASSFAFDGSRSNHTLATTALSDTSISEQPSLFRNGVGDQTLVAAPTSATNEWSLVGTTVSIHSDITATNNTYRLEYMISGGGGGPSSDDITKVYDLQATTDSATAVQMTTNGATPATGNSIVLDDDSCWVFDILVSGRSTLGDSAGFQILACLARGTGVATTAIVGTVSKSVIGRDNASWDVTTTADTTLGAVKITVQGVAATDIEWSATVRRTKIAA